MMHSDGWEWGFGFLGFALSVAVSIVFFLIVVAIIIKLLSDRQDGTGGSGTALRALDELYARGEITRDEYLERKSVLRA